MDDRSRPNSVGPLTAREASGIGATMFYVHRLTKKAWFGPKRYLGWGLTVRTWQGAVVTVVFGGLFVAALAAMTGPARFVAAALVLAAFIAVAFLTGDPPGGPRSRR